MKINGIYNINNTDSNLFSSSHYLLISRIAAKSAIAVDAEGREREVAKDFLASSGVQKVSWIYPYEGKKIDLVKGISTVTVLNVQKTLKKLGYLVKLTGVYDNATLRCVKEFQKSFGLIPDGIFGSRTRAFLYQVSD